MLCPLTGAKVYDQAHTHDACSCLDSHTWVVEHGHLACLYCGIDRCPQHRSAGVTTTRCIRRDGHGKKHLYTNG